MAEKDILDIEEIDEENLKLDERLKILSNRFKALAIDYRDNINNSIEDDTIFDLRDRIDFRLYSSIFFLKLALARVDFIEKDPRKIIDNPFGYDPVFSTFKKELIAILDSFIFHTTAVFDYIGILINYISCGNKEKRMEWGKLTRSVRGENNPLSKKLFSKTIDSVDKEFVSQLYDYRCLTIHREPDYIGEFKSIKFGKNSSLKLKLITGSGLVNGFKELKKLNKENYFTISYSTFWVINNAIDKITDILFSLKNEIESKSKNSQPFIFKRDPNTNEKISASKVFWHEDLYKVKKK